MVKNPEKILRAGTEEQVKTVDHLQDIVYIGHGAQGVRVVTERKE